MAKATKTIVRQEISDEEKRSRDLREIEDALITHKEVIKDTLEILDHMQDKGILSLMKGLFGQGDKILDILVKTADNKETANTIKNLLLMTGVLGMINVKQLEPFLMKVNSGIARVAVNKETNEKTGYFDLAKSLKDPEVNRAVTLLLTFLKGMGEETQHVEKGTRSKEDQARYKDQTLE
ncbi:DUF1641 domain-containing protein [Metabacillus sp. SLBN-84]